MKKHTITAFTVAALVGLGAGTVLAQPASSRLTPGQRASGLADALNISSIDSSRRTDPFVRIVGFVWTEDDRPVAFPRLVIRDLANGDVIEETTGTRTGEFRFEGLRAGTYVIELLGDSVPSTYSVGAAPASGGSRRFSNGGGSTDRYTERVTVERSDRVLAVSQTLTVAAGDTVGTFIRVGGTIRPGLIFEGSSVFESAGDAKVGGTGGGNPASSER